MLQPATSAISRGFSIFPVEVRGKRPHRDAGEWGRTSTKDLLSVIRYWSSVPANIGVACKPSGLLVVDCDTAKTDWNLRGTDWEYVHGAYGARVDGVDLLDEVAYKRDADPIDPQSTYSVQTGSGGLHLYFSWPAHWPKPSQASIVKGVIDVRNSGGEHGGYVLGAGSITDDEVARDGTVKPGGVYEVVSDAPVALTPGWLFELVREKPQPVAARNSRFRQPGAISFTGLESSVRNAAEGNRNNALAWATRTMCEEGATEQEVHQLLGPAARDNGLSHAETERTIQSAYRTQQRKATAR